jgi:hypothetical protein
MVTKIVIKCDTVNFNITDGGKRGSIYDGSEELIPNRGRDLADPHLPRRRVKAASRGWKPANRAEEPFLIFGNRR